LIADRQTFQIVERRRGCQPPRAADQLRDDEAELLNFDRKVAPRAGGLRAVDDEVAAAEWTVGKWLAALDDFRNWLIREAA
jgi:hypothetical protein